MLVLRLAQGVPLAADGAATSSVMLPISSNDPSPHLTRFGGALGLRGFAAELS